MSEPTTSPRDLVRIFYCGVPLGAEMLRRAGHAPVAMALAPLDLPGRRRLRRSNAGSLVLGLPDLEDPQVQRAVRSTRPTVLLSFFWPKRIPDVWLSWLPAYGTHPSLLPRWRGPDPYFWAIYAGDRASGVTLHALEPAYDTGAIVARRAVDIDADETAWSLARKLDRPAIALLVELAERLCLGKRVALEPQVGETSWAREPTEDDTAIDWRRPACELHRLIRAASPIPGAEALFRDQHVVVARASLEPSAPPLGLRIGEAWRTPSGWAVRCGEGALRLERVLSPDDERTLDLDQVFDVQRP